MQGATQKYTENVNIFAFFTVLLLSLCVHLKNFILFSIWSFPVSPFSRVFGAVLSTKNTWSSPNTKGHHPKIDFELHRTTHQGMKNIKILICKDRAEDTQFYMKILDMICPLFKIVRSEAFFRWLKASSFAFFLTNFLNSSAFIDANFA